MGDSRDCGLDNSIQSEYENSLLNNITSERVIKQLPVIHSCAPNYYEALIQECKTCNTSKSGQRTRGHNDGLLATSASVAAKIVAVVLTFSILFNTLQLYFVREYMKLCSMTGHAVFSPEITRFPVTEELKGINREPLLSPKAMDPLNGTVYIIGQPWELPEYIKTVIAANTAQIYWNGSVTNSEFMELLKNCNKVEKVYLIHRENNRRSSKSFKNEFFGPIAASELKELVLSNFSQNRGIIRHFSQHVATGKLETLHIHNTNLDSSELIPIRRILESNRETLQSLSLQGPLLLDLLSNISTLVFPRLVELKLLFSNRNDHLTYEIEHSFCNQFPNLELYAAPYGYLESVRIHQLIKCSRIKFIDINLLMSNGRNSVDPNKMFQHASPTLKEIQVKFVFESRECTVKERTNLRANLTIAAITNCARIPDSGWSKW